MANRYINATLRFYDKFSQPLQKAALKAESMSKSLMQHHDKYTKLGKQFDRTGRSMTKIGTGMTKTVTAPIAGIVGASLRAGMAFDQQMSKVQAISGATGGELAKLRENAKHMGATTKFSATEAGQALEYMAMAGWNTKQMNDGLAGVMNLAAASGEDLGTVSDIVTDSMTAFGLEASQSSHFADVLAAAASNANTNVGLMGESFKYVAPLAGSLKFSVEDTTNALGLMANSGIKSSQAGTAMNAWLTRMAKPTKESEDAMSKLGLSMTDSHGKMKTLDTIMQETRKAFSGLTESQKAQYAAQLAGQRGMPGLLAIVNSSTKDYNKMSKAVHNTKNNAEEMAKTMMNNGAGALTILKSSLESAGIAINDRLAPYVVKIIGFFQKMVDRFNSLSPKTQDFIIKIALLAATIGPGIAVAGKFVSTYGKIFMTLGKVGKAFHTAGGAAQFFSNKFPLISKGVKAARGALTGMDGSLSLAGLKTSKLGTAVSKVGKAFGKAGGAAQFFSNKFPLISKGVKAARGALTGMDGSLSLAGLKTSKLGTAVSKVSTKFSALGKMGRMFASPWGLAIGTVGAGLVGLYKKNDDFRNGVNGAWKSMKTAMGPSVKGMMSEFAKLETALQPVIKVIGKSLGQAISSMGKAMTPIIQTVGPMLVRVFRLIGSVVKKLSPLFRIVFRGVAVAVKSATSSLRSNISGILKIFRGVIKFISGVFSGNWKKAWEGVKSIFSGIWDTFAGIVKAPLNAVISAINWVIDGLNSISIDVPDWVPGVGGKHFGFNISHIAKLEKGTPFFSGGMALVGERGPEIVQLPRGSRVNTNSESKKMMGTKSVVVNKLADKIVVREEADIDKIATALARKLEDVEPNVV